MTFLRVEAPLRLKVDGHRKPLRLRFPRRDGALETFEIEGEAFQAVRFYPAGAVNDSGGQLIAIPAAADAYNAALDAFAALGERLRTIAPRAALRVEAVSRTPSGCFWLQSRPGMTLETWLAHHPGPIGDRIAAAFARRLAEALGELHAVGIVHGDLCPRNVLIDDGEVRLTGFMVDRRPFFRALRSQDRLVEPGYAPPEAHDGAQRHPVSPAADLYAASALLQRLLTGQTPPAANLATRIAGENAWPNGLDISPAWRKGIEAGLMPAIEARPTDAATWVAGLALEPEFEDAPWFEGLARASSASAPPPPEQQSDALDIPPQPTTADDTSTSPFENPDGPLTLARSAPPRRRFGWWIAGSALATLAIAATSLVIPQVIRRSPAPPKAEATQTPAPQAPTGCQWLATADGWRLRCANAPAQGLRLPERFDAQTVARAAAGEPAAMERLGSFYRLRAAETDNPDRGAYAYQALDWLERAADAPEDGRPDTARARDDAALALGHMLSRGEGGRAPDPTAAEARLRQAAAGSRADAVLALGQFLEAQNQGDADRSREARGLYARVAQLGDGSALQREAERGLARIDVMAKPPVQIAPRPVETPTAKPRKTAAPKMATAPASRPEPRVRPQPAPSPTKKAAKPTSVRAAPPKAKPEPAPVRRPAAAPSARLSAPAPKLRTWTASTFIKVDPTTNFSPSVELAGRAACDSEGGETLSVRTGDVFCPNGVDYCQVRAVATCQGARP